MAQCPDEQKCNVPTAKNKNHLLTIYSQNLEIQSRRSREALVEAKKRERAMTKRRVVDWAGIIV